MAYIVHSTERVKGIGAEYETKAMLYLMSGRQDSHEIYSFAIDFFNDVTGLSLHADKAWDLQSKGTKTGGPKEVGKELVTLFKNFMSDLHFDYLILFLAVAPPTLRKDNNLTTFMIDNVSERVLENLKEGLIEEARKKSYIEDELITEENINAFLKKVTFVVDDRSKAEYVKNIISLNSKFIPKDSILDGIFNKIRDAQAGKKNNESVENEMVYNLRDAFAYDRTIKSKEIRLMVINTLVNREIVGSGAPLCFMPLIQRYDGIRRKEVIEDCQLQIAVALSDKANSDSFWDLLDVIIDVVTKHKEMSVADTYELVEENITVKGTLLDVLSIQYLISVMKEALENDN